MFYFTVCNFKQFNINDDINSGYIWHQACMPGDSIAHLRDAKIEDLDPNIFDNSRRYMKYEAMDFIYKTQFECQPGHQYHFRCDGLDTIAHIYLNKKLIHESHSSFIALNLDLSAHSHIGTNELVIHFLSPTEFIKQHRPDFDKQLRNVLFDEKWRCYLRKPQWHYGWDNAPHLAGVGFIGTPTITSSTTATVIKNLAFNQHYDWKRKSATFTCALDADTQQACAIHLELRLRDALVWQSEKINIPSGNIQDHEICSGQLDHIEQWNCVGMGEPTLYQLNVYGYNDKGTLAPSQLLHTMHIGFREITLEREVRYTRKLSYRVGPPAETDAPAMDGGADIGVDKDGNTLNGAWSHIPVPEHDTDVEDFCLMVNGERIFIEGFDWQPVESNLSNVDPDKLRYSLQKMAELNVNSVRVWGGAYIESDDFYTFCDQHGIVVWQDFLFACSLYPDQDQYFRKLITAEIIDICKRLARFPSVGVFCGSNEIDMMLEQNGEDVHLGNTIGHAMIPDLLCEIGSRIPYHVSSPAGTEYPRHPFSGECRNWTTMTHIGNDYVALREDESIMVSEGGCAAYPNAEQCAMFMDPEWPLQEDELLSHQSYNIHAMNTYDHHHFIKPITIHKTIRQFFGPWNDLEQLIYLSQLYQAEGLRRYVEIFRYKQQTMHGYYIWKFSDSWPCLSLAVLDYHNQPKMAYHALKRSMADITICPFSTDDLYTFSVFSRQKTQRLMLRADVYTLDGDLLESASQILDHVSRGINHTEVTFTKELLQKYDPTKICISSTLTQADHPAKIIHQRPYYLTTLENLDLQPSEINATLIKDLHDEDKHSNNTHRYTLSLSADTTHIGVYISIQDGRDDHHSDISDNCFDILAKQKKIIVITSTKTIMLSDITIRSYKDWC